MARRVQAAPLRPPVGTPPDRRRAAGKLTPGPPALEAVLATEGWPYASALPVEPGDPGRFNALFGRDSLITALQVLDRRPDVARATLRALAGLQGTRDDPETEEEPGKIVHEWRPSADERLLAMGFPVRDGALRYYGSADATSWFCVVLAALRDARIAAELEESWRAAGAWLARALERGGGFVRHGPRPAGGLIHQGWRDSVDPLDPAYHGGGIVGEDGVLPAGPLADADSQAVALVALRALARLSGDATWERRAAELGARVSGRFAPDTMALDGDGRPVRGAGSQLGWLLWAGGLPAGALEAYAERLCGDDVLTDWGLRTLSSRHPAFDPLAYHRGSVWPFDSWLGWGGLRAAGRSREAERVRTGVLAALDRLGHAPELYAVGPDGPEPVAIANRVQAWTIGARAALEAGWDGRAV